LVACAGGELWAVDGGGTTKLRTLHPDLRDVWTDGGGLAVSRFRAAEVVRVTAVDALPITPPRAELPSPAGADSPCAARVAWRTVADPAGNGAWMLHQRHMESPQGELERIVYGSLQRGLDDRVVKPAL